MEPVPFSLISLSLPETWRSQFPRRLRSKSDKVGVGDGVLVEVHFGFVASGTENEVGVALTFGIVVTMGSGVADGVGVREDRGGTFRENKKKNVSNQTANPPVVPMNRPGIQ